MLWATTSLPLREPALIKTISGFSPLGIQSGSLFVPVSHRQHGGGAVEEIHEVGIASAPTVPKIDHQGVGVAEEVRHRFPESPDIFLPGARKHGDICNRFAIFLDDPSALALGFEPFAFRIDVPWLQAISMGGVWRAPGHRERHVLPAPVASSTSIG